MLKPLKTLVVDVSAAWSAAVFNQPPVSSSVALLWVAAFLKTVENFCCWCKYSASATVLNGPPVSSPSALRAAALEHIYTCLVTSSKLILIQKNMLTIFSFLRDKSSTHFFDVWVQLSKAFSLQRRFCSLLDDVSGVVVVLVVLGCPSAGSNSQICVKYFCCFKAAKMPPTKQTLKDKQQNCQHKLPKSFSFQKKAKPRTTTNHKQYHR